MKDLKQGEHVYHTKPQWNITYAFGDFDMIDAVMNRHVFVWKGLQYSGDIEAVVLDVKVAPDTFVGPVSGKHLRLGSKGAAALLQIVKCTSAPKLIGTKIYIGRRSLEHLSKNWELVSK